MQSNIIKGIEKIFIQFDKLDRVPKALLKYGSQVFLALFALGTLLVFLNRNLLGYDSYFEFIALNIVKSSFTIFAEVVIGALAMDFIFNKK
jgi:hypothetical protein